MSGRIAVIRPCCIGDCVMSLPAIDALAAACPGASIDVYVGDHSRAIFEDRPGIVSVRRSAEVYDPMEALRLGWRLRRAGYDTIVILERSRWPRLAARLAGAPSVAAMRRARPETRHESEAFLDVVRDLGIHTPWDRPYIVPPGVARSRARKQIDVQEPFVVLQPGGAQNPGARMLSKRWPAERFIALAMWLRERGFGVVLTGGPGDRPVAEQIAGEAGIPRSWIVAGGVDLMTAAAVIERSVLYVGGDTGMSHIAAAVDCPTIAIFGPTNPRRYRPLGRYVEVLAPPASWRLPDVNLRREREYPQGVSTGLITVDMVIAASERALSAGRVRGCRD